MQQKLNKKLIFQEASKLLPWQSLNMDLLEIILTYLEFQDIDEKLKELNQYFYDIIPVIFFKSEYFQEIILPRCSIKSFHQKDTFSYLCEYSIAHPLLYLTKMDAARALLEIHTLKTLLSLLPGSNSYDPEKNEIITEDLNALLIKLRRNPILMQCFCLLLSSK